MDFGIDPDAVGVIGSVVHDDGVGSLMIVGGIAFVGFFARLVFLSFADRAKAMNPFAGMSGGGLILVAFGIFVAGLFITNKQHKALIMVKRTLVDPVIVTVLQKDSCSVDDQKSYCVVVFEGGREMVVNWYDHRVDMYSVVNLQANPPWHSLRPLGRATVAQNQNATAGVTSGV